MSCYDLRTRGRTSLFNTLFTTCPYDQARSRFGRAPARGLGFTLLPYSRTCSNGNLFSLAALKINYVRKCGSRTSFV